MRVPTQPVDLEEVAEDLRLRRNEPEAVGRQSERDPERLAPDAHDLFDQDGVRRVDSDLHGDVRVPVV